MTAGDRVFVAAGLAAAIVCALLAVFVALAAAGGHAVCRLLKVAA